MFRAAFLVLSGNVSGSILGLIRNLVIARMISVENFGIAATFAIALSVIEMVSTLGLGQQIVQARDGNDERFQAALHGFQLLRGIAASLALYLLAGPMARFMNLGDLVWAYQIMALVPLVRSLYHFDATRLSRQRRFGPMVLGMVAPPLVALVAVWPLVLWLGDYRVMLGVVLIQSTTGMMVSHLVAVRAYRVVFDRAIMARSMRFGWPILVNNILLFGVFQGDRLIVGRELGVEALAVFSMAVTLTLTPTLVLTKTFQNLFLPVLSAAQDRPDHFSRLATTTLQITLLAGLLLVAGAVAVGQPLALLLLGVKYAGLMPLLNWMALVQALRMVNGGPAIVALSLGETSNAMYANLARIAVLPLIWYVAVTSSDLLLVVQITVLAELIALTMAFSLLRYKAGVNLQGILPATWATVPFVALIAIWARMDGDIGAQFAPTTVVLGMGALIAAAVWKMPELRSYARGKLRRQS